MKEFTPHRDCKETVCFFKKYCVDAACLDRDIATGNLPTLTFDWVGILEGRMNAYNCNHKDAQEARRRVQAVINSIPKPSRSSE
jgi:hypothetical protein